MPHSNNYLNTSWYMKDCLYINRSIPSKKNVNRNKFVMKITYLVNANQRDWPLLSKQLSTFVPNLCSP